MQGGTLIQSKLLPVVVPDDALLSDVPFAVFGSGAFIMALLALGQAYLTLNQMILPVEFRTDTGIALLLGCCKQLRQFLLMQQ